VKGEHPGKTIVDGNLRYTSVSSVKLFDPRTKGGCPRRWFYRYALGMKEEVSANAQIAMDKGLALDVEIKHYLRTGEKNLSSLALKGMHILETPGEDLKLDLALHRITDGRIESALTAAGVPFVGELDIAHERGHYRDDEGEFHDDPPGTVEVIDLKFKSNAKDRNGNSNLLGPTDLIRDIQMAGYGEWVTRVRPATTNIRLSLAYFPEKGDLPTKVTRLHVLDDTRRTWEYVTGVVTSMVDVAKETDVEKIPGNTGVNGSCDAYGGCARREYCTAYRRTSLDNLYGKIASDHLNQETAPMGLLSNSQILQPPQPDTRAALLAEEAQMRTQVAQQQAQMPQQLNTAELVAACMRLAAYGYGFPALAGNAAQAYALAGGQNVAPGFVFQGQMAPPGSRRSLHSISLTEVGHIYQLESELADERGNQPQPIVAPQQQVIAPVVSAPPVDPRGPAPFVPQQMSFLPPGAPESIPALAQARYQGDNIALAGLEENPPVAAPKEKKTRGRPPKAQDAAPEAIAAVVAPPPPAPAPQVPPVTVSPIPTGMMTKAGALQMATEMAQAAVAAAVNPTLILINARSTGVTTRSLAGYVDHINAELSKRYCVTADGKPGVQDVRCAPKDSVLAFGGWRGAVREIVKADPPGDDTWHLDTYMDELNEVVADALRVVAEARGWLYVRGVGR
jgi:hypothetical protein